MRVIIKEPNDDARIEEIEVTLEELQQIVGGYIEIIPFTFDSIIICNEEGRLRNLPFNFQMPVHGGIVGTAIICDDNEEFNKILEKWGNVV